MRIVHEMKHDQAIQRIAREMINIEYNKIVYDGLEIQPHPWKPYVSSGVNGVQFYIHANVGYIYVLHIQEYLENLIAETETLDKQLNEYPNKWVVMNPDDISTIGATHYGEYKKCMLPRIIYDATLFHDNEIIPEPDADNDQHTMYTWYIYSGTDIILRDQLTNDRKIINQLLQAASCIIYDPEKIFNFEDNHLQLNFPLSENLTCFQHYMQTKLNIHVIYGIRWHIYRGYKDSCSKANCFQLTSAVYKECIDNIKLFAFNHDNPISTAGLDNCNGEVPKYLRKVYECSIDSAPESRCRNDICNVCQTPLYDDIYVMEIITYKDDKILLTHLGLCVICIHSSNNLLNKVIREIKKQCTFRLLKVRYPRTFMETLTLLKYSEKDKRIMNIIYNNELSFDGSVLSGNKITSIETINDILCKSYNYNDMRCIFRYTMIYQNGV